MAMDNPCRYCVPPKRHIGCHGTCPERKDWEAEEARKKELRRLDNIATHTMYGYRSGKKNPTNPAYKVR